MASDSTLPLADLAEIRRSLELLMPEGAVLELRGLHARTPTYRRPHVESGFFSDPEALAQAAATLEAEGTYISLNPVDSRLLARSANRLQPADRGGLTTDRDVLRRTHLLVDLDAVRPSGISSTEEELQAAIARARELFADTAGRGWPAPAVACSGNGAHLVYGVDLPADDQAAALVKRVLLALAARFSDDQVAVDTSVFNASRITRLIGTSAQKGSGTPDRPHRTSRWLSTPEVLAPVPVELLEDLAGSVPTPTRPTPGPASGTFSIEQWLAAHTAVARGPVGLGGGGRKWILESCPWADHRDGAAFVLELAGGAIAAGCLHASCRGRGWHDLRDALEPGWRERRQAAQDARQAPAPAPGGPEARGAQARPDRRPKAVTRRLSTVTPERVEWTVPERVPRGKLTVIAGRPGLGKSLLGLEIAAAVTRGRPLIPGEEPCLEGNVLILAAEDGIADTVVPRLLECGADLTRVLTIEAVEGRDGERAFTLAEDLVALEAVIDGELQGDLGLLIVDPPSGFLGRGIDSHRDADVRGVLSPLAALADRRRFAVLMVAHHRKQAGQSADAAISGSLAFGAAARQIWHVVPSQIDKRTRLLLPGKSNLCSEGQGMRFVVDGSGDAPRISWLGPADEDVDDLLASSEASKGKPVGRPASALIEAASWLDDLLARGPVLSTVVEREAERAGISKKTLQRAKDAVGAVSFRPGTTGGWYWRKYTPGSDAPSQQTNFGHVDFGHVDEVDGHTPPHGQNSKRTNPVSIEEGQNFCVGASSGHVPTDLSEDGQNHMAKTPPEFWPCGPDGQNHRPLPTWAGDLSDWLEGGTL